MMEYPKLQGLYYPPRDPNLPYMASMSISTKASEGNIHYMLERPENFSKFKVLSEEEMAIDEEMAERMKESLLLAANLKPMRKNRNSTAFIPPKFGINTSARKIERNKMIPQNVAQESHQGDQLQPQRPEDENDALSPEYKEVITQLHSNYLKNLKAMELLYEENKTLKKNSLDAGDEELPPPYEEPKKTRPGLAESGAIYAQKMKQLREEERRRQEEMEKIQKEAFQVKKSKSAQKTFQEFEGMKKRAEEAKLIQEEKQKIAVEKAEAAKKLEEEEEKKAQLMHETIKKSAAKSKSLEEIQETAQKKREERTEQRKLKLEMSSQAPTLGNNKAKSTNVETDKDATSNQGNDVQNSKQSATNTKATYAFLKTMNIDGVVNKFKSHINGFVSDKEKKHDDTAAESKSSLASRLKKFTTNQNKVVDSSSQEANVVRSEFSNELEVIVLSIDELQDALAEPSVYVCLQLLTYPDKFTTARGRSSYEYNEQFTFKMSTTSTQLRLIKRSYLFLNVYHKDADSSTLIGDAQIPLAPLSTGQSINDTFPLTTPDTSEEIGRIRLGIRWKHSFSPENKDINANGDHRNDQNSVENRSSNPAKPKPKSSFDVDSTHHSSEHKKSKKLWNQLRQTKGKMLHSGKDSKILAESNQQVPHSTTATDPSTKEHRIKLSKTAPTPTTNSDTGVDHHVGNATKKTVSSLKERKGTGHSANDSHVTNKQSIQAKAEKKSRVHKDMTLNIDEKVENRVSGSNVRVAKSNKVKEPEDQPVSSDEHLAVGNKDSIHQNTAIDDEPGDKKHPKPSSEDVSFHASLNQGENAHNDGEESTNEGHEYDESHKMFQENDNKPTGRPKSSNKKNFSESSRTTNNKETTRPADDSLATELTPVEKRIKSLSTKEDRLAPLTDDSVKSSKLKPIPRAKHEFDYAENDFTNRLSQFPAMIASPQVKETSAFSKVKLSKIVK